VAWLLPLEECGDHIPYLVAVQWVPGRCPGIGVAGLLVRQEVVVCLLIVDWKLIHQEEKTI
jgi:hypothetical protein